MRTTNARCKRNVGVKLLPGGKLLQIAIGIALILAGAGFALAAR
ncbi:MAG TPA: hypothetical protein VGM00_13365 [Bradyrhizobium sp.]